MATLTVLEIDLDGLDFSGQETAETGDEFANNGRTFLYVKNVTGNPITVTFTAQNKSNFGQKVDKIVTVGGARVFIIGPFMPQWLNDSNGKVQFLCSVHESVIVMAVRILDAVGAIHA